MTMNLLPKIYPPPERKILNGSHCVLQPFDKETHSQALFKAFSHDKDGMDWTYLPYGPFCSEQAFYNWVNITCLKEDPLFYTVCTKESLIPVGMLSLLKIERTHGKIEIGDIHFSKSIQQTIASTETLYLMMQYVFDELGYRRLEWKCDNANEPSKRAALRLGFVFEGVFRQHWIIKSKNRDTAWYSIIDKEWPEVKERIKRWLDPTNFNSNGQQIKKLAEI